MLRRLVLYHLSMDLIEFSKLKKIGFAGFYFTER
jgi:hypothetical protein